MQPAKTGHQPDNNHHGKHRALRFARNALGPTAAVAAQPVHAIGAPGARLLTVWDNELPCPVAVNRTAVSLHTNVDRLTVNEWRIDGGHLMWWLLHRATRRCLAAATSGAVSV